VRLRGFFVFGFLAEGRALRCLRAMGYLALAALVGLLGADLVDIVRNGGSPRRAA
jgi:hypothetical protein